MPPTHFSLQKVDGHIHLLGIGPRVAPAVPLLVPERDRRQHDDWPGVAEFILRRGARPASDDRELRRGRGARAGRGRRWSLDDESRRHRWCGR